jgi:hypothetical protein
MAPTPVPDDVRVRMAEPEVTVAMAEGKQVPDRYDEAVAAFMEEAMPADSRAEFEAFVAARENADDPLVLADRYLEWRVETELEGALGRSFRGQAPADLDIELVQVNTPNAATMMLVGEIKSARYEATLTDRQSGKTVVSYGPVTPIAEPSAGAGGGLLGMALRTGDNQLMNDLEVLAESVSAQIKGVLIGPMADKSIIKKINVETANISAPAAMPAQEMDMPLDEAPDAEAPGTGS